MRKSYRLSDNNLFQNFTGQREEGVSAAGNAGIAPSAGSLNFFFDSDNLRLPITRIMRFW